MKQYDVVIAGAGLVGATLALALHAAGFKPAVIEAHSFTRRTRDQRLLVLTKVSQQIFTHLAIWRYISAPIPIDVIHVSYRGRLGRIKFVARQFGLDNFGYLLPAAQLLQILRELIQEKNIPVYDQAVIQQAVVTGGQQQILVQGLEKTVELQAKLLVAADGTDSTLVKQKKFVTEQWDYQQSAQVATITLARAHPHIAYERFLPNGHLALLPLADKQMNLIWVTGNDAIEQLQQKTDVEFLHELQELFGYRLGKMIAVSKRTTYPLKFHYLKKPIAERLVVIGNAAHTIHPLAAQGFNLGLRDVACLVEVLQSAKLSRDDIGSNAVLQCYLDWRRKDYAAIINFVNRNVFWQQDRLMLVNLLRDMAMLTIDLCSGLKKQIADLGMGFRGRLPRVC